MKQVLQYPKQQTPRLEEVPSPQLKGPGLLVSNRCSLVVNGLESQQAENLDASAAEKAEDRTDIVRQFIEKIKSESPAITNNKTTNRIKTPLSLGISSAGVVKQVHASLSKWTPGERVACAGYGYASHAEKIFVPTNLAAKIPDNVSFEEASFVTFGAIAMQGVRIADTRLGETVAVMGLGLLGQITCMLLAASGCRVLGLDTDNSKFNLATKSGAEATFTLDGSEVSRFMDYTAAKGVDAVIITSPSDSSNYVEIAGQICREKGRVVVVGTGKMEISPKAFYEKELELRISRSYGPGRFDYNYEEAGRDYPYGYVRFTENRNMESFLRLISLGRINIKELITHRFDISDADKAYELVSEPTSDNFLGVILNYPEKDDRPIEYPATPNIQPTRLKQSSKLGVGLIGAGEFATTILLPHLAQIKNFEPVSILSGSGISAAAAAEKYNFRKTASALNEIMEDPEIGSVFIANRHDQHAELVMESILNGKPTFVEKPLCVNRDQLEQIKQVYRSSWIPLMVGYNRRFAPFIGKIKEHFKAGQYPLSMHYRVNAGFVPSGNWRQDQESGGGRVIGEICQFVDVLSYIAGARPSKIYAEAMSMPDEGYRPDDNLQIMMRFANGSVGTINYVASGSKYASKEYLEVMGNGTVIRMDDFKTMTICDDKGMRSEKSNVEDKGHRRMLELWCYYLATGLGSPIPFDQIVDTTQATFEILDSMAIGEPKWINL